MSETSEGLLGSGFGKGTKKRIYQKGSLRVCLYSGSEGKKLLKKDSKGQDSGRVQETKSNKTTARVCVRVTRGL